MVATLSLAAGAALAHVPPRADPPGASAPQSPAWVFESYGSRHGFPHGPVTALAQDGDGFLWIGTPNGLLRWDGYELRHYMGEPRKPGSRDGVATTALHADALGRLWIGTRAAGLASYDRDTDSILSYPVGPGGVPGASVQSIVDDGARGVWIATSCGVGHLKADGSFEQLRHDPANPDSLPDDRVAGLLLDRQGGLWIGTRGGLVRRAAGTGVLQRVVLPTADARQPLVESLLQDGSDRVWIGSEAGAFVYEPFTGIARRLPGVAGEAATGVIRALAQRGPGDVWFATSGAGIVAVDARTLAARRLGEAGAAPKALLRDRSGLAWVGLDEGLVVARPAGAWTFKPPLVLTSLQVGGRPVPVARYNDDAPKDPLVLRPEANRIEVAWAALDFSDPARNRYSHRLEGLEAGWTRADAMHHSVAYADLAPGDYVLRLRGSNREGGWGERDLALPIRVLPAWHQSLVLRAALGCAGLLLVAGTIGYLRRRRVAARR